MGGTRAAAGRLAEVGLPDVVIVGVDRVVAIVGLPIGLLDDAPDFGVFISMSVEHNFRTLSK